ncbi:MAG: antitoxin VapB family protein [Euryarchaeota archaeon]|nr:antitoxin VapB family protein [Euryarchaeota archaeon]
MTKVISLSDKAYEVMVKLKKGGESFSDVVLKLSKKKEKMPLTVFAGKWKGGDVDRVFGKVMEDREKGKSRGAAF